MPTFSQSLEQSLHRALAIANERHHQYATLEHLLLSLIDDSDAAAVMRACNVDLRQAAAAAWSITWRPNSRGTWSPRAGDDAKPTPGFQRVIQRAIMHVQSTEREEVTGANVLIAIFAERESHAAYFLQQQDMTRFDAVNYISHGIAKRPGVSEARPVRGVDEETETKDKSNAKKKGEALEAYCVNLNKKAREGKIDPLIGRKLRGRAHDPDAVPPPQEQSAVRRRSRGRQDRDRRGARRSASSTSEVPDVLARRDRVLARHGLAAGGHQIPRRFRGAAEGGAQGGQEAPERDPVHRRNSYRDRRRRGLRRRHGRVEPAEAGARLGHLRCIGSTTYKEYRSIFEKDRALARRFQKIDVTEPTVEDTVDDPARA